MANIMAASMYLKIALVCLLVGLILYIIGFSTVSWMVAAYSKWEARGVWRVYSCRVAAFCTYLSYGAWDYFGRSDLDYVRATQALECIGFVFAVVAFIVLMLYLLVDSCRRRNALIAFLVCVFAAVFFIIVGIAVFATKHPNFYRVGWSMGFAIVGTIFMFVSGIMGILQLTCR
ncbi:uncharacterized protein [Haliotis asinina]|uniref:uncharacterized protein n=1 Tax=Haliotis asinina TaxID=109174 RepID=UPI003531CB76